MTTTNSASSPEAILAPVRKRGRPAKQHNNTAVGLFVRCFWNASDMIEMYPKTDDILSGVLALKSERDTATRSLSRSHLFKILGVLPRISAHDVRVVLGARYNERTCQKYAAAACTASKALASYISTMTEVQAARKYNSRLAHMQAMDAPYRADATKAEALSANVRGVDTLGQLPANERTPEFIMRRCGGYVHA
jgi:hypothetical protein